MELRDWLYKSVNDTSYRTRTKRTHTHTHGAFRRKKTRRKKAMKTYAKTEKLGIPGLGTF